MGIVAKVKAGLAAGLGILVASCASAPSSSGPWQERMVVSDDVTLRVFEAGDPNDPLLIFVHGWPELAYSWRYQIPALVEAGYHVVVPDMRGYGASDTPYEVEAYTIQKVTQDVVNLIDHYGEEDAFLVGHDWGAIVSWNAVLLHPDRFKALAALSVPYNGRGPFPPTTGFKAAYKDNFFYILYFQEDGVAETEFDSDPRGILESLYVSPDTPMSAPELTDPKMAAGGWIPRRGKPLESPEWLSEEDLDYYVDAYETSGFRGGINYYRNFDANWASTPELTGAKIDIPVFFLAGEKDSVIGGASAAQLRAGMERTATDLRGVILIPEMGHWVQQEAPEEVNAALIEFFDGVER